MSLALACDLRIASKQAKFKQAFTSLGLAPDVGWSLWVGLLAGFSRTSEMIFLDPVYNAEEALAMGLVHRLAEPEKLSEVTRQWAEQLTAGATQSFAIAKAGLKQRLPGRTGRLFDKTKGENLMKDAKEFKLIECRGTPYEIGRQWGEGCKESIFKISENIYNSMAFLCQASKEEVVSRAMKFLPAVQAFDPYLVEIMRGQADATGLSFEEIFTQKCFNELTLDPNNISGLCTSFAATRKATQDGKTILGQNIDFLPGTPIDLLKIHHANGLVQFILSFSNSSEFTLSSAGIGMCGNATIGQDYSFNIPVGCYLPRVMRGKNIHDAMDMLKQVARGLGYYHLADIHGHMSGIESIHNDFELLYPERDLLLHSNHYLTERFEGVDTAPQFQPDSYHRLDRIRSLMNQHYGHINIEIVMKILADHDRHPYSICRHIDPTVPISSTTLASFIMVPAEGAIYIAAGHPCEYEYVRYEF